MFAFGTILGFYLIIGFSFGVSHKVRANRDPELLVGANREELKLFNETFVFLFMYTLIGVPIEIQVLIDDFRDKIKMKKLPIVVRGKEIIVLTEMNKEGHYLVEEISLHHDSLDFLDDLIEEEFIEWVEEIRQQLNEKYKFNREVLLLHLADVE